VDVGDTLGRLSRCVEIVQQVLHVLGGELGQTDAPQFRDEMISDDLGAPRVGGGTDPQPALRCAKAATLAQRPLSYYERRTEAARAAVLMTRASRAGNRRPCAVH
jgi:hypothetical protein